MNYSFWSINSEDPETVHKFLNLMGYKKIDSENTTFDQINLSKLWFRKYLFCGSTQVALIRQNNFSFLVEEIPSSLFYADINNLEFSKTLELKTVVFFHYPSAKSTGLKIFENGKLIRHLQSEIDYEISHNAGNHFSFEAEVEKEANKFNEKSLKEYLTHLEIPIPQTSPNTTVELLTMAKS